MTIFFIIVGIVVWVLCMVWQSRHYDPNANANTRNYLPRTEEELDAEDYYLQEQQEKQDEEDELMLHRRDD